MFDGNKNAGHDRDGGKEIETPREPIAEEETGAQGREHRLDIEHDVHDRRIPLLQCQSEKYRSDRRASETGEDQVAPGARLYLRNLTKPHHKQRQKHEENEDVLPEDDHLGVEEIVERNAPRALRAPEGGAEGNEPRAVPHSACRALSHAEGCIVGAKMRQRSQMEASAEKWRSLLGEAPLLLPRYLEATDGLSHESKGIRRSELFFFYALGAPLHPARIVESGRARAQSTLVLARLFPQASIVSLESDNTSPDVEVAAARLRDCANVDCCFGDSLILLPDLVRPGDVVLIDGPKDFRALKLALRLLAERQPAFVFVHDLWPGSPARRFVDLRLPSALLSDEPQWVARYAALDSSRRNPPEGIDVHRAYGATLGCFEIGQEDYRRRLLQCRAAQGADRMHATVRKFLRRAPVTRPKDFEPV